MSDQKAFRHVEGFRCASGVGAVIALVEFLQNFREAELGLGVGFESVNVFVIELALEPAMQNLDIGVVEHCEVVGKGIGRGKLAVQDVSFNSGVAGGSELRVELGSAQQTVGLFRTLGNMTMLSWQASPVRFSHAW